MEIDTRLEIATVLKFTDSNGLGNLNEQMNHIFAMLTNLINKSK